MWETARVYAVFMDPKDDGIGEKKEPKDARAWMRVTYLGRLYVVGCRGKHEMKERFGPTR